MKVDGSAGQVFGAGDRAAMLEDLGVDGVATSEVSHDPFFPLVAAALATERVELITSIAVAFARNPMTIAQQARDLNDLSQGRFVLGLGSQIKPHITRRFSMPWSEPAGRMREFVEAVRAIWDSWRNGTRLRFEGRFYCHTLMPPMMVPEPTPYNDPRIVLGAVNGGMARVAGAVADGLHCHAFCTPRWIREVIVPAVEAGLAESGRKRSDFEIACPLYVVTGPDEHAVRAAYEDTRKSLSFYGSTPAYRPVLELHGWGGIGEALHDSSKKGEWDRMAALVPDEIVETFAVIAPWDGLGAALAGFHDGMVDRVMYGLPFDSAPPAVMRDIISELHAASATGQAGTR